MVPDESLLIAAFSTADRAASAWREWSRSRDLNALDPRERRLLPAVYQNLRAAGVADGEIAPIVKQMSRSMFVRTRLLVHEAAEMVRLFESAGIESVLLKGCALIAAGYIDAAARPMADFDLLIRPAQVLKAVSLLREHGWTSRGPIDQKVMTILHAALFKRGDVACDVHWSVFWESRDRCADERLFEATIATTLDGVRVHVPRPEYLLLTTVIHGTRRADNTSVRWLGDALAILRQQNFDWPLFESEVRSRNFSYPIGASLAYLRDTFGADVPASTIDTLSSQRVRGWQRRMYKPRPHADRNFAFFNMIYYYFGSPGDRSLLARLFSLPRALQTMWGVPRARVPAELMRRGIRKLLSRT